MRESLDNEFKNLAMFFKTNLFLESEILIKILMDLFLQVDKNWKKRKASRFTSLDVQSYCHNERGHCWKSIQHGISKLILNSNKCIDDTTKDNYITELLDQFPDFFSRSSAHDLLQSGEGSCVLCRYLKSC